jgi:hypothetical protein
MKKYLFNHRLKKLMEWLHAQAEYWSLFKLLPNIDNSKYAYELDQQLEGVLSKFTKLEPLVEFFDLRIAEFEKKMLYYDEFDTTVNRARLSELIFLRKRLVAYMQNLSTEEKKKLQRPFNIVGRK